MGKECAPIIIATIHTSFLDDASYTTIPSLPFDTISTIRYSPTDPDQLLVSSWDTVYSIPIYTMHVLTVFSQTVRFYQVGEKGIKESEAKAKFDHRAPVLACCFSDGTHGYSGGLDTSVREYLVFLFSYPYMYHLLHRRRLDLSTERMTNLGTHNDSISSMSFSQANSMSHVYCIPLLIIKCAPRCSYYRLLGPHHPILGSPSPNAPTELA